MGTWTTSTNPLPLAVKEHSAVVWNGYIYTTGGAGGSATSSVFYAPINPTPGEVVIASSTPATATGRIKYRLSVGSGQAAGTYTNLVDFIATPTF